MNHNERDRSADSIFVDGTEVPYHSAGASEGDSPVLVMVHGSTGSTDSHYGYLFPMLAFRQRVVSIDLQLPTQGGALALEQLVRQVGAVIDRVSGGKPVSLMGYSLGAVVAAAVAWGGSIEAAAARAGAGVQTVTPISCSMARWRASSFATR